MDESINDAIIGRNHRQREQDRRELERLKEKLKDQGKLLSAAADALRSYTTSVWPAFQKSQYPSVESVRYPVRNIPADNEILGTLDEIERLERRIADATQALAQFDIID